LKDEINQLIRQGELDVDVVYVSKLFHVDYDLLEKNLRKVIEKTLSRISEKPVLIYGDLCLGPNEEMKELAKDYGMIKVDALNCIDCLLGGKAKINDEDPNHDVMFMDPGMIEFFQQARLKMRKEGIDEETMKNMFAGLRGVVLLDTLGEAEKCKAQIDSLNTGLEIIEVKKVGTDKLRLVILEALKKHEQEKKK
jgi:hypothetical protein